MPPETRQGGASSTVLKDAVSSSVAFTGNGARQLWFLFHFEDPRLEDAVSWLKDLGVTHLRTGLSWWDSYRPGWEDWFDRQMEALADFETTVTFCFTPDHEGIAAHYTSPPRDPMLFADFCGRMIERYAPAQQKKKVA